MNVIFVLWFFLWICATCGAREIPERSHHFLKPQQSDEDSESDRDSLVHHQHLQHHYHNHHHQKQRDLDEKRSQSGEDEDNEDENDDFESNPLQGREYPIVTTKRAALLLDRIMVALHHALEDTEDGQGRKINDVYRDGQYYNHRLAASKAHVKDKFYVQEGGRPGKSSVGYSILHKEIPVVADGEVGSEEWSDLTERSLNSENNDAGYAPRDNTMDLQRRGHDVSTGSGANAAAAGKGRVYWRCYFNAVTCF